MIGIFDSGVGGMTVARAIEELLPAAPILYLGDIARTPYGSKSARTIIEYSIENTRFLVKNGAEVIVVACNTAASVASERLRQEFHLPIIDVIAPAVAEALRSTRNGRIGVIGTRATVQSEVYQREITRVNPNFRVISQACPLLVPLVEEGWTNRRETKMILRRYLHPLKDQQIDTLVLGCTHYPLLTELIQPRVGKRVRLIDSSRATAAHLRRHLADQPDLLNRAGHQPADNRYHVTDLTDSARQIAARIFGRTIELISL
jgi:glutamate racemase